MSMDVRDYLLFGIPPVCFLTSLIVYFQKNVPSYLKFFPPFLLAHIVMNYLLYEEALLYKNNQDLYNLWSIMSFTFWFFILWQIIYSKKIKRIVFFSACFYPIITLINIWYHGAKAFSSINFDLGSILIIVFASYYFYEL